MQYSVAFRPTPADIQASADRMLRWMQLAFSLHPALSPHCLRVFLTVACDPGHGPTYYAKKLELHQPEVTRVLLTLGQGSNGSQAARPGLGLIDYDRAPQNMSQHRYFLTEEGVRLIRALAAALHP